MSLLQYTIVNQSAVAKTFTYFSASAYHKISVGGFDTVVFDASSSYAPTQDITGIPEVDFVSDAYIPPSGSAWLWNNGEKVQYIKISDTPLTGSNISSIINRAEWIEFSMVEAIDKNGNYLYPTSPNSARVERYIIDNANDKGLYNSIIINNSSTETSIAVSANTSSAETGFSYIDQQFSIDQNCDPLLNNATEPRINEWLQDVDYSVNAITPINFNQLINFTATKASVPQSNYTQLGFVHSRYVGSSTTREQINEYDPLSIVDTQNKLVYSDETSLFFINKGKGPTLGKIPNVELNNAYIAYFNKIIDPYPILNNKVAYYVKFLVDDAGNILDPILSDTNFSVFKDTFQLKDYDNQPTRVNTTISSIDESKELLQLNEGLAPVFKIGQYPVPILYTQTSSIGHANEISLSGSNFFSGLGLNSDGTTKDFLKLGVNIYATQSNIPNATIALTPININTIDIEWNATDSITPFISNDDPTTIPTSSVYTTSSILFPLDSFANPPSGLVDQPLSDNYIVKGEFTFTTSTMPAVYKGAMRAVERLYIEDYLDSKKNNNDSNATKRFTFNLKPYVKPPNDEDSRAYYINTGTGFKVNSVRLKITEDPGGPGEFIYNALTIERGKVGSPYGIQWNDSSTGLTLTPDSLYLEKLIIENLFNGNITDRNARKNALKLIAGGWQGNPVKGYGGIAIRYDWTIDFEFNDVKQGTGIFFTCEGILDSQSDSTPLGSPSDVFLFFGPGANADIQWRRTFTPTFNTNVSTKPIIKYSVTSPLSENATQNQVSGPFWRRYPLTNDELYMSSSLLNQTYGLSYYQARLDYKGDRSTDFPLTIEPGFIEFDPVSDPWKLELGDEIRFENNEKLTFKITLIDDLEGKNINSEAIADKLRVKVFPPFQYVDENGKTIINQPSNFDFFVVRRYKDNKNFIILDQQMPYGFSYGNGTIDYSGEDIQAGVEPVTRASSPGILLPEHRIEVFNKNPDLILKDLIEKGIIT
jgi:hypothetical protein